ncbi:glutamine--fructose-6-phosphate transaminase (isomerizing) [Candidatus Micrarchaeota archaeon]|nr:glutamine--fructose-6-phosphate transaminase (isomerizing) [Candidatus Micrarchaeota archaeon]
MCGIVGYIGKSNASEILTEGLKRLEYRGYDSVGIAVLNNNSIDLRKEKGMFNEVSSSLNFVSAEGNAGIGHTRWATHGVPCKRNAHPHSTPEGDVVLVHNGVIENFSELKQELISKGHTFESDTDTEVIAHLISENMKSNSDTLDAFIKSLKQLSGSYAIVALLKKENKLYVAKKNSPLVLGLGENEYFCASDIPAMIGKTKTFLPMKDGEIAVLSGEGVLLMDMDKNGVKKETIEVDWDIEKAEKGGYPHFMLKEIMEQEHSVQDSLSADVSSALELLNKHEKIDIIACGTSYHAGLIFKYLLETRLKKKADVIIASEYSYSASPDSETLVFAISQSGETADVIQSLKFAKEKGAKSIALTNIVGSSITRMADKTIFMNAGPEIGVAATKTFTSQLAVIYKLVFPERDLSIIKKIIAESLKNKEKIKEYAENMLNKNSIFFIGRGLSYPIAREGALKLKEISYLHAEAYPGGELKHGPLSLIEEGVPVVVLSPNDNTAGKMMGNLKEVSARGAYSVVLTDNKQIEGQASASIPVVSVDDPLLYPFSLIIPLQFLSYYVSTMRGLDPDKPRNLAKSVTVE